MRHTLQVRQQSKDGALRVRRSVEEERQRQLSLLAQRLYKEWLTDRRNRQRQLELFYQESIRCAGQSHENAETIQQLNIAKVEKQYEQLLANCQKSDERFRIALRHLRNAREEQNSKQNARITARKLALQIEQERAQKIASKPLPIDRLKDIVFEKRERYKITDESAFTHTYHHTTSDKILVDRATLQDQENLGDVHLQAQLIERETNDVLYNKQQVYHERMERARLRHKHARAKHQLKQDYQKLLLELSDLQRDDILKRQDIVADIPSTIFAAPHRRAADKIDRQHNLEHAFEDLYMEATDYTGDLSLTLQPIEKEEKLPASEMEMGGSEELSTTPGSAEGEEASEPPVAVEGEEIDSTTGTLDKLLNRIDEQRRLAEIKLKKQHLASETSGIGGSSGLTPGTASSRRAVLVPKKVHVKSEKSSTLHERRTEETSGIDVHTIPTESSSSTTTSVLEEESISESRDLEPLSSGETSDETSTGESSSLSTAEVSVLSSGPVQTTESTIESDAEKMDDETKKLTKEIEKNQRLIDTQERTLKDRQRRLEQHTSIFPPKSLAIPNNEMKITSGSSDGKLLDKFTDQESRSDRLSSSSNLLRTIDKTGTVSDYSFSLNGGGGDNLDKIHAYQRELLSRYSSRLSDRTPLEDVVVSSQQAPIKSSSEKSTIVDVSLGKDETSITSKDDADASRKSPPLTDLKKIIERRSELDKMMHEMFPDRFAKTVTEKSSQVTEAESCTEITDEQMEIMPKVEKDSLSGSIQSSENFSHLQPDEADLSSSSDLSSLSGDDISSSLSESSLSLDTNESKSQIEVTMSSDTTQAFLISSQKSTEIPAVSMIATSSLIPISTVAVSRDTSSLIKSPLGGLLDKPIESDEHIRDILEKNFPHLLYSTTTSDSKKEEIIATEIDGNESNSSGSEKMRYPSRGPPPVTKKPPTLSEMNISVPAHELSTIPEVDTALEESRLLLREPSPLSPSVFMSQEKSPSSDLNKTSPESVIVIHSPVKEEPDEIFTTRSSSTPKSGGKAKSFLSLASTVSLDEKYTSDAPQQRITAPELSESWLSSNFTLLDEASTSAVKSSHPSGQLSSDLPHDQFSSSALSLDYSNISFVNLYADNKEKLKHPMEKSSIDLSIKSSKEDSSSSSSSLLTDILISRANAILSASPYVGNSFSESNGGGNDVSQLPSMHESISDVPSSSGNLSRDAVIENVKKKVLKDFTADLRASTQWLKSRQKRFSSKSSDSDVNTTDVNKDTMMSFTSVKKDEDVTSDESFHGIEDEPEISFVESLSTGDVSDDKIDADDSLLRQIHEGDLMIQKMLAADTTASSTSTRQDLLPHLLSSAAADSSSTSSTLTQPTIYLPLPETTDISRRALPLASLKNILTAETEKNILSSDKTSVESSLDIDTERAAKSDLAKTSLLSSHKFFSTGSSSDSTIVPRRGGERESNEEYSPSSLPSSEVSTVPVPPRVVSVQDEDIVSTNTDDLLNRREMSSQRTSLSSIDDGSSSLNTQRLLSTGNQLLSERQSQSALSISDSLTTTQLEKSPKVDDVSSSLGNCSFEIAQIMNGDSDMNTSFNLKEMRSATNTTAELLVKADEIIHDFDSSVVNSTGVDVEISSVTSEITRDEAKEAQNSGSILTVDLITKGLALCGDLPSTNASEDVVVLIDRPVNVPFKDVGSPKSVISDVLEPIPITTSKFRPISKEVTVTPSSSADSKDGEESVVLSENVMTEDSIISPSSSTTSISEDTQKLLALGISEDDEIKTSILDDDGVNKSWSELVIDEALSSITQFSGTSLNTDDLISTGEEIGRDSKTLEIPSQSVTAKPAERDPSSVEIDVSQVQSDNLSSVKSISPFSVETAELIDRGERLVDDIKRIVDHKTNVDAEKSGDVISDVMSKSESGLSCTSNESMDFIQNLRDHAAVMEEIKNADSATDPDLSKSRQVIKEKLTSYPLPPSTSERELSIVTSGCSPTVLHSTMIEADTSSLGEIPKSHHIHIPPSESSTIYLGTSHSLLRSQASPPKPQQLLSQRENKSLTVGIEQQSNENLLSVKDVSSTDSFDSLQLNQSSIARQSMTKVESEESSVYTEVLMTEVTQHQNVLQEIVKLEDEMEERSSTSSPDLPRKEQISDRTVNSELSTAVFSSLQPYNLPSHQRISLNPNESLRFTASLPSSPSSSDTIQYFASSPVETIIEVTPKKFDYLDSSKDSSDLLDSSSKVNIHLNDNICSDKLRACKSESLLKRLDKTPDDSSRSKHCSQSFDSFFKHTTNDECIMTDIGTDGHDYKSEVFRKPSLFKQSFLSDADASDEAIALSPNSSDSDDLTPLAEDIPPISHNLSSGSLSRKKPVTEVPLKNKLTVVTPSRLPVRSSRNLSSSLSCKVTISSDQAALNCLPETVTVDEQLIRKLKEKDMKKRTERLYCRLEEVRRLKHQKQLREAAITNQKRRREYGEE